MSKELKNRDLLGLLQGLQLMEAKAYNELDEIKPTILHQLVKNRKTITETLVSDFDVKRVDLVEKLGKRNKKGELIVKNNTVSFNKKQKAEFDESMNKLMDTRTSVNITEFDAQALEDSGLVCCPKDNQYIPLIMEVLVK